jgi:phosphoglycerate dehydrogenase-like enzyme
MDVVMYDPYRENGAELSIGVKRTHSLEDLFSRSDVVSIHAPLSSETENLISEKVLRSSKPGLILINTARGPIVDLDALYNALKNDHIEAVGVDVLPEEPADPEHPLIKAWANDEEWIDHRLLITPHSAFFTPESVYDMRYKGGEVAVTYLSEGRLQNCVNEHLLESKR